MERTEHQLSISRLAQQFDDLLEEELGCVVGVENINVVQLGYGGGQDHIGEVVCQSTNGLQKYNF